MQKKRALSEARLNLEEPYWELIEIISMTARLGELKRALSADRVNHSQGPVCG